jgi:hypothetical protein
MGLRAKADSAVRKVAFALGIKYVMGQIRAAADGKLGPGPMKAYWTAAGAKTVTGLVLALVAAVALALGSPQVAETVGVVAGFAISAGLVDKAWRTTIPEWLFASALYHWLAAHAALLSSAFSLAWVLLQAGGHLGMLHGGWAEWGPRLCIVVGAVCTQLGLLDAGWRSAPPALNQEEAEALLKTVAPPKGDR